MGSPYRTRRPPAPAVVVAAAAGTTAGFTAAWTVHAAAYDSTGMPRATPTGRPR